MSRLDAVITIVAGLDPIERARLAAMLVKELETPDAITLVIFNALRVTDEKLEPESADYIYGAILSHCRARRPESVSCLSVLPEPTEPNVDPRERG